MNLESLQRQTPGIGQLVDQIESPELCIDLDVVDRNVTRMLQECGKWRVNARVHFKSLKCGGLARYLSTLGVQSFLCAKLNEAEVLAHFGFRDILIANQIVGATKIGRVVELSRRAEIRVCVDNPDNVDELAHAARAAGTVIGVLIEVDIGMKRCGVDPGAPALELAKYVTGRAGLRFDGLQGYDGHLQLVADPAERRRRCLEGLDQLVGTRRLIEQAGIPVTVVTGAGTGTWEFVASYPGVTEIQPGSFVLMDCIYHTVRPEFGCALSVLARVISKRPGQYILDAGSKAISKDFGLPTILDRPEDRVLKLAEEHTFVESSDGTVQIGQPIRVIPAHCCATMNLHRRCIGIREKTVQEFWPIEASGRYD